MLRKLTFFVSTSGLLLAALFMPARTRAADSLPAEAPTAPALHPSRSGTGPLDDLKFDPATITGAPGFFRIGRTTAGRWLFIDPDDNAFFYRGVTSINRAGTVGGRRAVPGPYALTVQKKFGKDDHAFVMSVIGRLRELNFNAMGAWTTSEFFDQGMPYTEITEFAYCGPQIRARGAHLPDVFDPKWAAAIDAKAKEICTPRRDSKMLVGYFTDNEMGWGQAGGEAIEAQTRAVNPSPRTVTLLQALITLAESFAGGEAAWTMALSRHDNSIAKLSTAWELPFTNRQALRAALARGGLLSSHAYSEDCDAFSHLVAHEYFKKSAEAIRKYDPNHLILGCRFGGPPGAVVLDECRRPWVDVLSANNYRVPFFERIDEYHKAQQMPILIGEFAWISGHFTDDMAGAEAEKRIIERGPPALEKALTHPALAGYTWYRWVSRGIGQTDAGLVV